MRIEVGIDGILRIHLLQTFRFFSYFAIFLSFQIFWWWISSLNLNDVHWLPRLEWKMIHCVVRFDQTQKWKVNWTKLDHPPVQHMWQKRNPQRICTRTWREGRKSFLISIDLPLNLLVMMMMVMIWVFLSAYGFNKQTSHYYFKVTRSNKLFSSHHSEVCLRYCSVKSSAECVVCVVWALNSCWAYYFDWRTKTKYVESGLVDVLTHAHVDWQRMINLTASVEMNEDKGYGFVRTKNSKIRIDSMMGTFLQ